MTEKTGEGKAGTNWFWWGIGIVVAYVGWLAFYIGLPTIDAFFQKKSSELNSIGDFLAGVFAFPAFVLLATAVLTQRQELDHTRKQLSEARDVTAKQMEAINRQNDIALNAAKANYKVQVHDKRMIAYQRLLDIELAIIRDGDVTRDTRAAIYKCAADAKFVFGDVVNEWISSFISRGTELRGTALRLEKLEKHMERMQTKERSEWHNILSELHERQQWFFDNLTRERIEEVLGPSLRLPEDIE